MVEGAPLGAFDDGDKAYFAQRQPDIEELFSRLTDSLVRRARTT